MKAIVKNKIAGLLVVLLLVANLVSLAVFWLGKEKPLPGGDGGDAAAFIIKELQLDAKQQKTFLQLRTQHHQQVVDLQEQTRQAKDAFFNLLNKDAVPDSEVQAAEAAIMQKQEQIDLVTFAHFKQLRAICTEAQKKKFELILREAIHVQSPKGLPAQPSGPPPPNGNTGQPPLPPPGDSAEHLPR